VTCEIGEIDEAEFDRFSFHPAGRLSAGPAASAMIGP